MKHDEKVIKEKIKFLDLDNIPAGKRKVLLASLNLFSKNGFNGTSTAQIAESAGVSQATIFKYFKTKQDLLLEIIAPLQQSFKNDFLVGVKEITKLDEVIGFIVNDRFTFFNEQKDLLKIVVQEFMVNPSVQRAMQSNIVSWKPEIDRYLEDLKTYNSDMNQDLNSFDFIRIIYGTLIVYLVQSSLITNIFPSHKPNLKKITNEILLLLRNKN